MWGIYLLVYVIFIRYPGEFLITVFVYSVYCVCSGCVRSMSSVVMTLTLSLRLWWRGLRRGCLWLRWHWHVVHLWLGYAHIRPAWGSVSPCPLLLPVVSSMSMCMYRYVYVYVYVRDVFCGCFVGCLWLDFSCDRICLFSCDRICSMLVPYTVLLNSLSVKLTLPISLSYLQVRVVADGRLYIHCEGWWFLVVWDYVSILGLLLFLAGFYFGNFYF